MAKCIKCSGNNAQKASMIEKAGSSSTKGVGVAGGGFGLGYAESKSGLAKEASFKPPSDGFMADAQGCFSLIIALISGFVWYAACAFIGFEFDMYDFTGVAGAIGLFVVPVLVFVKLNSFGASKRAEERVAIAKMEHAIRWICLDCGHKWVAPYKMAPKQPVTKEDSKSRDNSFGCIKPIGLFLVISIGLTIYFADRVSWVNVDSLNIRSEPDGEVIGKVTFGEKLTIKETDDGWKRIARGGWVNEKFLSVSDPNKADD